jgi:hypothetical protein
MLWDTKWSAYNRMDHGVRAWSHPDGDGRGAGNIARGCSVPSLDDLQVLSPLHCAEHPLPSTRSRQIIPSEWSSRLR